MSPLPPSRVDDRCRFLARAMMALFLVGWVAWFWPFDDLLDRQGTPLGADFSMFYVAGQVAADRDWEHLYDQAEHQRRSHQLFPKLSPSFSLPFRYPPAVAWLMSPFARLPYAVAWSLFTFLSSTAAAGAMWLLVRGRCLPRSLATRPISTGAPLAGGGESWRTTGVWICLGWPVTLEVLIGGQASLLALAMAVASCVLLAMGRPLAAGAALALSAYKPNVLALLAVGVAVRHPRVILGAIPILVIFLILNCLTGTQQLVEYVTLTRQLASQSWDVETPYWKAHSLAPWFEFVLPGRGRVLALAMGLTAAIAIGIGWRRQDQAQAQVPGAIDPLAITRCRALALLLVVNALFNPYTPIYDLVLLLAAAWLLAESFASSAGPGEPSRNTTAVQWLLAGLFFGPHLSQGLARSLGVQLFPLLLLAMAAWIPQLFARKEHSVPPKKTGSPAAKPDV